MSPLQPQQIPQYQQQMQAPQTQLQQFGAAGITPIGSSSIQYQQTGTPTVATSVLQYGQNWVPQQQQQQPLQLNQPQLQPQQSRTQQFQTLQPQQQQAQPIPVMENVSQQYYYYYAQLSNPSLATQPQLQKTSARAYQYMPQYYVGNANGTNIDGSMNSTSITAPVPAASNINDANIPQQQQQIYAQGQSGPVTSSPTASSANINNQLVQVANSYQFGPVPNSTVQAQLRTSSENNSPPNEMMPNPISSGLINENGVMTKDFGHPRMITTMWEDEKTLCYQVEANNVSVVRRADNDMINGTKLLNVTKMSRVRRDGILRGEKIRNVVKIGSMYLKGVWIPFERAYLIAEREKIVDLLYPLFVKDIKSLLKQITPSPYGLNPMVGLAGGGIAGPTAITDAQFQTPAFPGTVLNSANQLIPMQMSTQLPYQIQNQFVSNQAVSQIQPTPTSGSLGYNVQTPTPASTISTNSAPLGSLNNNNSSSINIAANNSTNNGNMTQLPPLSYNSNSNNTEQYSPLGDNNGSKLPKLKSIVESGASMAPTEPEYVELRPSRKVHHHKKHDNDLTSSNAVENRSNSNSSVSSNNQNNNNKGNINNQSQVVGTAQGEHVLDNDSVNTTDSVSVSSDASTTVGPSPTEGIALPKIIETSTTVKGSTTAVNSRNESRESSNNSHASSISDHDQAGLSPMTSNKEENSEKIVDKTKIEAIMT